ncbi:AAA family ATPase [candidate division CSSED10-310 bacterium]|uniref:AAA family ATPase n=1 Tax=candidate division CSSED10-310 bacterium TaxID=2855610 RepID=A0ABV6YZR8_UNCC1
MKILNLRGKNIRSLNTTFELDFQSKPLAHSGIFAITGPTGSGKSTILDTLCLALYGTCPRVHRARTESRVQELHTSDSRTALSHGSSEGFAEVIFEIQGHRFRANWSVHRARGKREGQLQKVKRELVDETLNKTIVTGITPVQNAIEQLIKLNFQQFSRSALLAQGEFAAFLHAPVDERAKLLETITGLQIYSQISIAVHERARLAKEELNRFLSFLQNLPLPSEQERLELQENITTISRELETLEQSLAHLIKHVEWFKQLAVLEEAQQKAQEQLEQNRRQNEQARDQKELLLRIKKAHRIRAELEQVQRVEKKLKEISQRLSTLLTLQKKVRSDHEKTAASLEKIRAELAEQHKSQEEIAPLLVQARALDIHILEATRSLKENKTEYDRISKEKYAAQAIQQTIFTRLEQLLQFLQQADQWLEKNKTMVPLVEKKLLWQDVIERFQAGQQREKELTLQQGKMLKVVSSLRKKAAQLQKKTVKYTTTHQEKQSRLKELIDEADLHTQHHPPDEIQKRIKNAIEARSIIKELVETQEKIVSVSRLLTTNQHEKEGKNKQLEHELSLLKHLSAERETNLAHLEASQTELDHIRTERSSQGLRTQLKPGQPCPVCGSTTHPWQEKRGPDQQILAQIEKQIHELKKIGQKLDEQILEKEKFSAALKETEHHLEININRDKEDAITLSSKLAHSQKVLQDLAAPFPDIVEIFRKTIAELPGDAYDEVNQKIAVHLENAEQHHQKEKELNAKIQKLSREIENIFEQVKTTQQGADKVNAELIEENRALDLITSKLADIDREQKQRFHKLAPELDLISPQWRSTSLKNPQNLKDEVDQKISAYLDRKKMREQYQESSAQEKVKWNAAETKVAEISTQYLRAEEKFNLSAQELDALQTRRASIFEGQNTAGVEKQHKNRLNKLEENFRRTQEQENEAAGKLRETTTQHNEASDNHQRVEKDLFEANQKLEHVLQNTGLERAEAFELLSHSDQFTHDLEARLTDLKNKLEQAKATFLQRKNDLEKYQGEADKPAQPKQATADALVQVQQQKKAQAAKLQQLVTTETIYRQRMAEAQQLQKQLDSAHKNSEKWLQLDVLIGHHSGLTFRKFAQSLTFSHLIQHANKQLKRLAPRYRLQQLQGSELDVAIVDLDQAAEIRAINTLSGGETFLVSLALALALAQLSSHQTQIQTLFIDEGFGSLDPDTLDEAIASLEMLQAEGKVIGLISHLPLLQERIACQVKITPRGLGWSTVSVVSHGLEM